MPDSSKSEDRENETYREMLKIAGFMKKYIHAKSALFMQRQFMFR